MPTIYGIISRGYFPKELPPAFTSEICGSVLANNLLTLPNELINKDKPSKNVTHNLLTRANLRRRLGIPNPTNFFRLANIVVNNWKLLTGITSKSHISLTSPIPERSPRAISGASTFSLQEERIATLRSKSRYILKADINQFYHSIYTHSISWAIHGKDIAKKKRRKKNLIGNQLDQVIRNSQDCQTIGVPIGPDTSLLIAEIILSAIDAFLMGKNIHNGLRIIDDFEFGCVTLAGAEEVKEYLQEILIEYELTLNPNKTYIMELPITVGSLCISELRAYKFNDRGVIGQRHDILYYFNKAFTAFKEYPSESVLKYAISRLSGIKILKKNWTLCENLLLQCAVVEPSTLEAVINQLLRYRSSGYPIDMVHIKDIFNLIIYTHASLGHDSEVAWAMWGLLVMNLSLDDDVADRAANMNDSIVACLMLDARNKGHISSNISFSRFQSYMTTDELYGNQWLLAYEANVKGWLPSVTRSNDHVDKDKCFAFLKSKGVFFYDDTLSSRIKYKPPKPSIKDEKY